MKEEFGLIKHSVNPYFIKLKLFGLPSMGNVFKRQHFQEYRREKAKWVDAVHFTTLKAKPDFPLKRAKLKFTRFSASCPDYDGLVTSFKHIADALVQNNILADDTLLVTGVWDCNWEKTRRGNGFIEIEVDALLKPGML